MEEHGGGVVDGAHRLDRNQNVGAGEIARYDSPLHARSPINNGDECDSTYQN